MQVIGNKFGYILIKELKPQLKGKIIMPFVTKGMHAASVAEILSGEHRGQYVLYRANRVIKAVTATGTFNFIEEDSILSFVKPDENEEFLPVVQVASDAGKEGWIK